MLHNCTLHQEKSKEKEKFLLSSKWKSYFHGLDIFARKKNSCGRVLFQSTFTSFRNHPFLEIDFIAAAKIWWNLPIFSKHLFCKSMHQWANFRNTINQLHVNRTWSILAVISFMAVMSWIANVRHRACKSESVRT